MVENCRLHDNGQIGLFLCWRVRHGKFANNTIENNGHYGISIGHKDTDNEFIDNTIARNGDQRRLFPQGDASSTAATATHSANNKVLDNGGPKAGYGFYMEPAAGDIVIESNEIAETRAAGGTQRYGIYKVQGAGSVVSRNNAMRGHGERDYAEGAILRSSR